MSRAQVMAKRGFTDRQYLVFARAVGKRIDHNRKMRMLADYLEVSIFQLSEAVKRSMLENMDSVVGLIWRYRELMSLVDTSKEGIIASELSTTTEQSFTRFGDRNCLNDSIRKSYLSPFGIPLDVQAMIISETYGVQVDEQDLVDFMVSYPDGSHTYESVMSIEMNQLNDSFYNAVGFRVSFDFVEFYFNEIFAYDVKKYAENMPF